MVGCVSPLEILQLCVCFVLFCFVIKSIADFLTFKTYYNQEIKRAELRFLSDMDLGVNKLSILKETTTLKWMTSPSDRTTKSIYPKLYVSQLFGIAIWNKVILSSIIRQAYKIWLQQQKGSRNNSSMSLAATQINAKTNFINWHLDSLRHWTDFLILFHWFRFIYLLVPVKFHLKVRFSWCEN